ncbi:hypothetical protein J2T02_000295 [Chitinophaga terrae (ex Kim and Jung 2007)]|uniref:hypothetical protein n=1 Tax=Chitinophaga terrae (ex Kim and Jung 2007) TaxID=408074 RepID=UPI002789EAE7|nr:hypothetical protein [Chitinophaga terrae (ex Kim and Jung 2007)]MDQ0105212.1 hypothetical protein [Chitinophaga terrae (ex Kim and Jung 2007)]
MKKKFFVTLFLCFCSIYLYAQFQLGLEEVEVIRQANSDGISKITKTYSNDGTKVLTWKNEREKAGFIVGFDRYGYSFTTIIISLGRQICTNNHLKQIYIASENLIMDKDSLSSFIGFFSFLIGGVIYAVTHDMKAALICAGAGTIIALCIIFFKEE